MPDFSALKKELDFRAAADRRAILSQERERSLRERAAQLRRSAGDDNQDAFPEIETLRERAEAAAASYQTALADRAESRARLADIWQTLLPLTDPRTHIESWSDAWPVLLFPVRVETRFKQVTDAAGAPGSELWVRIYPDDCLVDTFEADLTRIEQQNARRFWAFYWAAAGDEEKERQAWRDLVTAHGSGRAGWIIEHYAPLNPADRPAGPPPDNTFYLTIPVSDTEPLGADAGTVADFWRAVYLGTENAANAGDLARRYPPANLREVAPEGATIQVVFVRFPAFAEAEAKPFSWSRAPQAHLLPERFVFLGYRRVEGELTLVTEAITTRPVQAPLSVGPNPTAPAEEQFQESADGDLLIPEEMRWMTDFDAALDKGMALRISLGDTLGFDRVLIVGLRLGSDPAEAKTELTELLRHHLYGRSGLGLIPQGTPTNNMDDGPSGFVRTDDPDESFPVFVQRRQLYDPTTDPARKTDGQRLAEWLGLDQELMRRIPNADQTDGAEALAMNIALWPATLGYWMQKMMYPVFRNETLVARTRNFFLRHVSGRGPLPAIRIGKQPYGILPVCAYRRIDWPSFEDPVFGNSAGTPAFLPRLHRFLLRLDDYWRQMSTTVPYVGRSSSDPQQQLLDIVGLHPNSAEYYARLGHSRAFLYNYFAYSGLLKNTATSLEPTTDELLAQAKTLLASLGYTGTTEPKIFEKYYRTGQNRLNGPIVDDQPPSETALVKTYTTDGKNYLAWLAAAVDDYEGILLPQKGFAQRPKALLYLLLRHALLEAYGNAGHSARYEVALTDVNAYRDALAAEPDFIHVATATAVSESRYAHLLANEPGLGNADVSLAQYLGLSLREEVPPLVANDELREMQAALAYLTDLPTARLERLLAEHIDCCTYRHDAWMQGIIRERLERKRAQFDDDGAEGGNGPGLYLGAFVWLEDLWPEGKTFTPIELPEDLAAIFQRPKDAPLATDTTNQGYIHAPSLNHAVTAAVLRNGYLSNATPAQPELLAVNLSSERVRLALDTLEGIRNGQSLGALLGYRFERKLHEKDPALFVFSYQLRRKFQLVANQLEATKETDPAAQEAIAARNVVDGYALLKAALGPTNQLSFGFLTPVLVDPAPSAPQRAFIEESIRDLLDIYDALSDLGLAESVHQIVQGNYERAASTLDAYSKATFPQTPDVVVTPRSGLGLTHRVAIHLDGNATAAAGATPRERAEPGLAAWLSEILPPLSSVGVRVNYTNPGTPASPPDGVNIALAETGLRALDLLYLPDLDGTQALGVLEERILRAVFGRPSVHAHASVRIEYTAPIDDPALPITFFELAPLLRSVRALVLNGRPLQPGDPLPPGEASRDGEPSSVLARGRIAQALPDLTTLTARITAWTAALPPVDQQLAEFATALNELGRYGLAEASFGFAYNERQAIYANTLAALGDYLARWADHRLEFDTLLAEDLPAAADDSAAIQVLRRAEALVSTDFITPVPPVLLDYRNAVIAKGNAFRTRQLALMNLLNNPPSPLSHFMDQLRGLLPLTDFDATDFTLDDADAAVTRLREDLLAKTTALRVALQQRSDTATARLAEHDAADATATQQLAALQAAARALFGDEFVTVPYFEIPGPWGAEWRNSLEARAELLAHAGQTDPFPVDTWLHGTARVRERLHHLENTYLLAEGFGRTPAELHPAQFPFRHWVPDPTGAPGVERAEPWLALEYPATFRPDEEKLLYTAAYATAFQPGGRQCGLLIDEWTEVIPTREETTGLAFHYDRPNTEAPQTMLLVTASQDNGEWGWDDLIAALHQTLDAAKQRAVEPREIEKTALGVFSPATVFPVTPWSLTPSLNLNWVNGTIEDA